MAKISMTVETTTSSFHITRQNNGGSRKDAIRVILATFADVIRLYQPELSEVMEEVNVIVDLLNDQQYVIMADEGLQAEQLVARSTGGGIRNQDLQIQFEDEDD